MADAKPNDPISPNHYNDLVPQPIEVVEGWNLGFHLGNTVKYISRLGRKPGADELEDMKKARWYLDRFIKLTEKRLTRKDPPVESQST